MSLAQLIAELLAPSRNLLAIELHHVGLDMLRDQFPRAAGNNDAAVIQDRESIAKALGFFHKMRGENDGFALR